MDETCERLAAWAGDHVEGRTVASAESFTAGVVAQALASAESSSDWFKGAVVAYQTAVKRTVLGVAAQDVVTEQAAIEMAEGIARLLDADIGISTTGVAGPDDQDGTPAGTVVIGWSHGGESGAEVLHLPGDPEEVVVRGATRRARAAVRGPRGPARGDRRGRDELNPPTGRVPVLLVQRQGVPRRGTNRTGASVRRIRAWGAPAGAS